MMTKKDLNNWIMYHELQKLKRMGFSLSKISHYLGMDARTVSKYVNMTEQEYEQSLIRATERNKALDTYESFVVNKLTEYPDSSTAQIHDWIKEHHPNFIEVTPRTVYNYVMFIRQKHNIPLVARVREYFPVEELPYGEQAQVDFGTYNMIDPDGKRKKVMFFIMVLSRSRMKYVWFLDRAFTSQTVITAHENAFSFYDGIPKVVVYDQDRVMIVDENLGDIILTAVFKQYTRSRSFKLHFCRKADPESKGKVENVVQYVKKNFLYNRKYHDLETLNSQCIAWLDRTANHLEHNYTKKSPQSEYEIEKKHLTPYYPLTIEPIDYKVYSVRKTNVMAYRGNFYILPSGTYKGANTEVLVKIKDDTLNVYNQKQEFICFHPISALKGKTIGEANRKRDTSKSMQELMDQTMTYFTDKPLILRFITEIKNKYSRYMRDHLLLIIKTVTEGLGNTLIADKTLTFCIKNDLLSAMEFRDAYYCILDDNDMKTTPQEPIILLDKDNREKLNQTPQTSNINDYERIVNQ